jgi:hypothetical protein
MKITGKYALLIVTGLALVALWWVNRQKLYTETFTTQRQSGNLFENFNTAQKDEACKSLEEQLKMYSDLLNQAATTEEEKQKKMEISTAVEKMKEQAATLQCS